MNLITPGRAANPAGDVTLAQEYTVWAAGK